MPRDVVEAPLHSPLEFVDRIIHAVSPLLEVDKKMEFEFKEGRGRDDVRQALLPVIGRYNVEEAASLYVMVAQSMRGRPCPLEYGALYETHLQLLDFISTGFGSGPLCVAARVELFDDRFADFSAVHRASIRHSIKVDIGHLIVSDFESGTQFKDQWDHRLREADDDE